ncbi:hypothetical protein ACLMJK_001115 [Lecanora helva]
MSSARQPFASLGGSRLRNMTNVKNQQNALPSSMPSSLKRHTPNEFDDIDSENIDPLMLSSPSKKSRSFDFDISKTSNTPMFSLIPTKKPAQYVERAQAAGQKRKADELTVTPTNEARSTKRAQPSSAPAPAGRSPKGKKAGILSRRRMTASPFTRINPPSTTTTQSNASVPFSIDAALAGTVPAYKNKGKSKTTLRKSWNFEIYEDTPEDEMSNLMEHSTCTLDISDDESRASPKGDKDNKENIPPLDGATMSSQVLASRRDMMTDEIRSPLGDLDAKDFYAEGCDESSVFTVDDAAETILKESTSDSIASELCSPSRPRANAVTDAGDDLKEFIAQVATKSDAISEGDDSAALGEDVKTEFQIWESESAKGDNDEAGIEVAIDSTTHSTL